MTNGARLRDTILVQKSKQRQSVKKRLEDWHKPVSGDMNVDMHMDMHMEGREEGDEEEIDL